jgi:hypothetical protein
MRHLQTTGTDPYRSAARSSQDLALNLDPSHLLHSVSPDGLIAAAGAVVVALLLAVYLTARISRSRAGQQQESATEDGTAKQARLFSGIGPQAFVALGGVAVSAYGLWGFATNKHMAALPTPLAFGFIGTFDAAEMILFGMLYRAADPKTGWTPELKLMHKTAWVLVAFSASMNAVHATTWYGRPVLAAVPALAAWLIELQLRAKLLKKVDPLTPVDLSAKPGPLKLLSLSWTYIWAWLFARFDIDINANNGEISKGALAQRAAQQVYRLRESLEPLTVLQKQQEAAGTLSRTEAKQLVSLTKEITPLRKKAQKALDHSNMATDSDQALAMMRRFTTLVRVDDVALQDCKDSEGQVALMEQLAVIPAARLIETSKRAAEVQKELTRSVDARDAAEAARERSVEAMEAAIAEREKAEAARLEAEEATRQARETAELAAAEAERAATARQQAEDARLESLSEITDMSQKAEELRKAAEAQQQALAEAADKRRQQEAAGLTAAQQKEDLDAELEAVRAELERLAAAKQEAVDAERQAAEDANRAAATALELQGRSEALAAEVRQQAERAEEAAELLRKTQEDAGKMAEVLAERDAEAEAQQVAVREAAAVLARLRAEIRDQLPQGTTLPTEVPTFTGSPDKQAAWEDYLQAVSRDEKPPTAGDITAKYGTAGGTVRGWLVEFRAKRAEMIAAGLPSGTEHRADAAQRQPSTGSTQPSASRARDHEAAEDGSTAGLITNQRVGV